MVGNDVVDLLDEDAGPRGPAFLRRVFAEGERALIERAADPVRMLWRLWAAKETAYKVLARDEPRLPFAQRRFEVDLEAAAVRHEGRVIPVAWEEGEGWLACAGGAGERWSSVERSAPGDDASRAARGLAERLLQARWGLDDVEVVRLPQAGSWDGLGPPRVRRRGRLIEEVALSLAHHGRFVACAIARKS